MQNGWTGGQYSVLRALFGAWFLVYWGATALGGAAGGASALVVAVGAAAAAAVVIGLAARPAVLVLVAAWGLDLYLHPGPGGIALLPLVGLTVFFLVPPPAPFGSWAARGRADPGGGWRLHPDLFLAVWLALGLFYGIEGWLGVAVIGLPKGAVLAPLALFPVLAAFRAVRPWLWLVVLPYVIGACVLTRILDQGGWVESLFVLAHLAAFDPGWIAPRPRTGTDRVLYDGACGLCHRTVRLLLAEDRSGTAFRFAPLGGPAFEAAVPEEQRAQLPDSLAVVTPDGAVLVRSAAALRALARLGGGWRLLGIFARAVPGPLADLAYDLVARVRGRLFAKPADSCPLIPPSLAERFDD